jgi:hypothetical protein
MIKQKRNGPAGGNIGRALFAHKKQLAPPSGGFYKN